MIIFFFYLSSLLPFPPPCSPTNCPISFKILLYKDNLSELQPSLGNWFLGSRNSRNSISKCSFFKDFPGKHVPRPPLVARIFGVQCFQIYVPSLKKMSKTLKRWRRQGGERFHFFSSLVHLSHSHMSDFTLMHLFSSSFCFAYYPEQYASCVFRQNDYIFIVRSFLFLWRLRSRWRCLKSTVPVNSTVSVADGSHLSSFLLAPLTIT